MKTNQMNMDPAELVKYIVWLSSQFDMAVTETRLVKYLYLIDLYHARIKGGKTLTGWSWFFVHFGPYCREAYDGMEQAVKSGLVEEKYYDSKYKDKDKFRLFSVPEDEEEPPIAEDLHIYISSQLQQIIKKYGDDTACLLDYVYYDTEPMRDALPKQRLDFTIAHKPEVLPQIEMKKLTPDAIERGAGILDKLKKKLKDASMESLERNRQKAESGLYDEEYQKALEYLEGEDLGTGLEGAAKVKP